MPDIWVDPETENPAYDLILDDGTERIGLVAVGDADALGRNPVEQSSLKTSTGDQSFSDLTPPYTVIAQSDWTGGRAAEEFEKDKTRYADGLRANTERASGVILSGREVYSTGIRSDLRNLPGSMRMVALIGGRRYCARSQTSDFNFNCTHLWLWVRRKGTPKGALTINLRSPSIGGVTGVNTLQSTTLAIADADDLISEFKIFDITSTALAIGTVYYIEAVGASGDNDLNHWEVGMKEDVGSTYKSSNGSDYIADAFDLYVRATTNTAGYNGMFFQYKKAQYFISCPDNGTASPVLINGVRGLATSNAGNMNKLICSAAHGLATDEAIGAVAMVIEGKGVGETDNYRTITANDANTFTVDSNWLIEHDSTTVWVVLGLDSWSQLSATGITKPVTDVHVASNGYVYFCQGEDAVIRRMKEEIDTGAWTRTFADETDKAVFMTEYNSTSYNDAGIKIVRTNGDGTVSETDVPSSWIDLSDWQSSCAVTKMEYTLKVVTLTCINNFSIGNKITVSGVNTGFTVTNIDGDWVCFAGTTSTQVVFKVATQPTGTTPQTITVGSVDKTTVKVGDVYDRITGIEAYKDTGGTDDAVVIFKESGPWMWQNGAADEMRTNEMMAVSSNRNGRVSGVQGVYLFFSVMNTVWRFYNPTFDDVGPTNDQGLPHNRQGYISAILSYPGRVIISVDAGVDGYSAVFTSPGSANWHEIYRAPKGERLRGMGFQVIPGSSSDRLWVHQGNEIIYIPFPSDTYDPSQDASYRFTHEFVLEFASISSGLYTAWKYWKKLQLRTDGVVKDATTDDQITWLECDYRLDKDDDWQTMPENFTEADVEEHDFDDEFGISSQILYMRVRGYSRDHTKTPRLTAAAVSGVVVVEPKFAYQVTVQALYTDKAGNKETIEPYEKIRRLDVWCGQAQPLKIYTTNPLFHNKKVFLMPIPVRPIASAEKMGEHEYQFSIALQEA
jgi:hypothetical protein